VLHLHDETAFRVAILVELRRSSVRAGRSCSVENLLPNMSIVSRTVMTVEKNKRRTYRQRAAQRMRRALVLSVPSGQKASVSAHCISFWVGIATIKTHTQYIGLDSAFNAIFFKTKANFGFQGHRAGW